MGTCLGVACIPIVSVYRQVFTCMLQRDRPRTPGLPIVLANLLLIYLSGWVRPRASPVHGNCVRARLASGHSFLVRKLEKLLQPELPLLRIHSL